MVEPNPGASDSSADKDKGGGAGAGGDAGGAGGSSGGEAGAGGQSLLSGAKPGTEKPASGTQEPGKATQPPQGAPEKYEFTYPEGVTPDEKAVEEATKVFKEMGLTQENAQKLVDLQSAFFQRAQEEAVGVYGQMRQQWRGATEKMLGGKMTESMALAAKARDTFGSKELQQFLDESGLGDHPAMVAFFVNIGRNIREDPLAEGKKEQGEAPLSKRLYPNLK